MTKLTRSLAIGCSVLALASCGPEGILSPGTGGNVTINNTTPAPTPTPTPTSTLVTAAGACPTISDPQGLVDRGTINGPTGTYRICELPARFNVSSSLPQIDGLLYRMAGRVDVGTDGGPAADATDGLSDTNVTLTIAPGAIIYASGSSFLNINRGNKINAVGTAALPIIFTSADNVAGFNGANSSGQWGGVVLSGRAPVTDCIAPAATPGSVSCERQVEGALTPALFGGTNAADNSGSMSYVQIRYSGFVLSGSNELQSLTTGGVGSGTVLDHIQSVNSSDDGVEFFGGRVNVKNLIVAGAEDDGLDSDTGVKLNAQYVLVAQRSGAGDTAIEADSSNGLEDQTPRSAAVVANATFIHRNTGDQVIRIRGGHDYTIVNSLVMDLSGSAAGVPCLRVDDDETIRAANAGLEDLGPPVFASVAFQCADDSRAGSGGGATEAQAEAFLTGGTGNNISYTSTLTSGYIGGASETGFTPIFNNTTLASTLTGFFEAATFIGAVAPSNNWTLGWTCDSAALTFGSNTGACTSLPAF